MMKTKSILTIIAFVVSAACIQAQNFCTGFDDCVIDANNLNDTRNHAFNTYKTGCLSDWEVVSGTPSLWSNTYGGNGFGNAYNGTQYASMGVCGDFYPTQATDAIALKYNFDAGKEYTVSMMVRTIDTSAKIDLNFHLLQSAIPFTYNANTGCTNTPAVPTGSLFVHGVTDLATKNWTLVTFTVSNLTGNYSRLWIRPLIKQNVTAVLNIDSVCVTPVATNTFCASFDDCVIDANNLNDTRNHAFNTYKSGCLSDWEVVSGTPSLWSNTYGGNGFGNAYNGTQYASMGVCGDFFPTQAADAIALKHNFDAGKEYSVSMMVRTIDTSAKIDLNYILLQSAIPFTYNANTGCTNTPAIPTGTVTVHTLTNFATKNWTQVNFTINNLSGNFTRLWLRPTIKQNVSAVLNIDSVCITEQLSTGFKALTAAGNAVLTTYPNPFSGTATIKYALPEGYGQGTLVITDVAGRTLRELPLEQTGSVLVDMTEYCNGIYLTNLLADGHLLKTGKMMLVK